MARVLTCLWLLALVHLVALLVVSIVQHFNMADLAKTENEVREVLVDIITKKIAESSLPQNGPHNPEQHSLRNRRQLHSALELTEFDFILKDMLEAQEKAIESHCTNATKVCPTGPKGEPGSAGIGGPQGLKGEPGRVGAKGVRGSTGLKGVGGSPGVNGPTGSLGDPGTAGATGPLGDKGDKGEKGQVGLQGGAGPEGARGDKGQAGPVGPQGPLGAKGPVGHSGPVGEVGAKGVQGSKGTPGPAGEPGLDLDTSCECLKMPKIREFASTVAVTIGLPFQMSCEADGNPSPSVQWSTGTGNILSFEHIQASDAHAYTCSARNTLGLDSKTVDLTLS